MAGNFYGDNMSSASQTALTVGAGSTAAVTLLEANNKSNASDATVNIWVVDDSNSGIGPVYLLRDTTIKPTVGLSAITGTMQLEAGDKIEYSGDDFAQIALSWDA